MSASPADRKRGREDDVVATEVRRASGEYAVVICTLERVVREKEVENTALRARLARLEALEAERLKKDQALGIQAYDASAVLPPVATTAAPAAAPAVATSSRKPSMLRALRDRRK